MAKNTNAREAEASTGNSTEAGVDQPTPEAVATTDDAMTSQAEVPADDPNKPNEILDESTAETSDRHLASTEMPVGEVTDPGSQADSPEADHAKEQIVPGAAAGPDMAGVVRNDHGKVAYAPPGSYNAAVNGVQQDASGHVDSVGTDNTSKSGTRA